MEIIWYGVSHIIHTHVCTVCVILYTYVCSKNTLLASVSIKACLGEGEGGSKNTIPRHGSVEDVVFVNVVLVGGLRMTTLEGTYCISIDFEQSVMHDI